MDGDLVNAYTVDSVKVARDFSDDHGPGIGITLGQEGAAELHFTMPDELARALAALIEQKLGA